MEVTVHWVNGAARIAISDKMSLTRPVVVVMAASVFLEGRAVAEPDASGAVWTVYWDASPSGKVELLSCDGEEMARRAVRDLATALPKLLAEIGRAGGQGERPGGSVSWLRVVGVLTAVAVMGGIGGASRWIMTSGGEGGEGGEAALVASSCPPGGDAWEAVRNEIRKIKRLEMEEAPTGAVGEQASRPIAPLPVAEAIRSAEAAVMAQARQPNDQSSVTPTGDATTGVFVPLE